MEREKVFPSYIVSISILNTHRISFIICIFNRNLFCELNLAGVFSEIYLASINNTSSVPDCPIFPLCWPSETTWWVKVWFFLFVSCIASITAFQHTFILLLHLLPSLTFIPEKTMHILQFLSLRPIENSYRMVCWWILCMLISRYWHPLCFNLASEKQQEKTSRGRCSDYWFSYPFRWFINSSNNCFLGSCLGTTITSQQNRGFHGWVKP